MHVFFFFYVPFWKICFYQAKYLFLFRYSKRLVCKLWGLTYIYLIFRRVCRIVTSCAIELDWSYILMDTRAAAWRISLFEEEYPFRAGEGVISLKVWPFCLIALLLIINKLWIFVQIWGEPSLLEFFQMQPKVYKNRNFLWK